MQKNAIIMQKMQNMQKNAIIIMAMIFHDFHDFHVINN